jgi:hypothetical protein
MASLFLSATTFTGKLASITDLVGSLSYSLSHTDTTKIE